MAGDTRDSRGGAGGTRDSRGGAGDARGGAGDSRGAGAAGGLCGAGDARWRVWFAPDLVTARRISLDDGVLWLRREALRIVLLDDRGETVDARFLREDCGSGR
nr:uncharacterized protein LOC120967409 isoform X2 [Aegilops tauschii subsp. strangulata]